MAKPASRSYSPVASDAATLMGEMIRASRIERGINATDLAARAGVSRGLLARVEGGDMGVAIGAVFEIAAVLGIPLFEADADGLRTRLSHQRQINALLPSRAFQRTQQRPSDDF